MQNRRHSHDTQSYTFLPHQDLLVTDNVHAYPQADYDTPEPTPSPYAYLLIWISPSLEHPQRPLVDDRRHTSRVEARGC